MKKKNKKQLLHLVPLLAFVLATVSNSPPDYPQAQSVKHFVLIHGSCHGAWSWYKLVALLKSSGHIVTALDLAASGVDPKQPNSLRSISEYIQPLMEFMAALPQHENVILVGHSLGGLAVSKAMEDFPAKISVAVFVTASMPGPSLNISTLLEKALKKQDSMLDCVYTYGQGPNRPPTAFTFGPLYLASKVYQLSPVEDVTLAASLMRPLPLFSEEDMSDELRLSEDKYGSVSRVFIVSEKDLVGNIDFQRWMIERNPPNHVVEIKGSDHMVMMSKPLELWTHLQRIAEHYP